MDFAATFMEHPTVGDVVSEGVLERILRFWKETWRIEKFSSLQIVEQTAKLVVRQPANCVQEGKWDVVSNDGRFLQQVLVGSRQRVNTRSEDCLHRRRDLDSRRRPRKLVAAARALEHAGSDQPSHDLFGEERIPAGASYQEALEGGQRRVGAQQGLKELREALAG